MSVIRIPPVLRGQAGNQKQLDVDAGTVGEALERLTSLHPGLRDQLLTADGGLNRFVIVYVNNEDIRYLQDLRTPVGVRDTIVILPAMAGG